MTRSFCHTLICCDRILGILKLKPTIASFCTINCISCDTLSQDSCVLPTHVPNRSALEFVYGVTGLKFHHSGNFPYYAGIMLYKQVPN